MTSHQRQNRLEPGQVAQLVADYNAGMSIQRLAAKYQVRWETVQRWLKVNDVALRPMKIGIPREKRLEAANMRAQGLSWQKIGDHYGCSRTAAQKAVEAPPQS